MAEPTSTEELIHKLRDSSRGRRFSGGKGIDWVVFGIAAVVAVGFVTWGFITPDGLGSVAQAALDGTIKNLGWLFVIAASVFAIFVIVVAASRFGAIPLGKDGEKPEYRTSSWIAMMFATGMGIGLIFYGVGEPLYFYLSPPPGTVEGQVPAAVATAMGTTMFHWTFYPWGMYAIVGLGMAYGSYRLGRNQLFSAMFTSLFGAKAVNGAGGRAINILAIIATLFGSACSLGLGALQIGGGLKSTGVMAEVSTSLLVIIIAVLTALFVASAVSGIERGIQWLSNINMVLAVLLAIIVFVGGPTLFVLNVLPASVGGFISDLPEMASRTAVNGGPNLAEWMSQWTIFYWAWWISWTPFVGLFIARISRGRTVRQFVTGVLLVPSVISLLWFAIFGGSAIGLQERAEQAGDSSQMLAQLVDGVPDINFDLILFDLLEDLPVPGWVTIVLMVLAVVLVAIFFVTGADSASIVMAGLSENGAVEPLKRLTVFWGVATGAVAAVMLLAGGDNPAEALNGLKKITIVSAVPFVIVMLILCVALWKDLANDPMVWRGRLARHVLVESVAAGVDRHGGAFALSTAAAEEAAKETGRRGLLFWKARRATADGTEDHEPAHAREESKPADGAPVAEQAPAGPAGEDRAD